MNYEEKRQLRLQISQLLADAGLNQGEIKRMVQDTLDAKIDRAIKQCIDRLNAETSSGDYIEEYLNMRMADDFWTERWIKEAVFKALQNRVLKICLDCDPMNEDAERREE